MTNIEYINRHTHWTLDISKMSDTEILAFMEAKQREVEDARISLVAATHVLKARGKETKELEDKLWREKSLTYVPPPEIQIERLQDKLSKTGASDRKIQKIAQSLKGLDFSDI